MEEHVFVIAEAGVNHNGDVALGRQLIDAAADGGADAVKFQSFRAAALASSAAPKAAYQKRTTGVAESQVEMLRRLELSVDAHRELRTYAERRGITFLSTPFDQDSLDLLVRELGLTTIKVGSGDLTNGPLLVEVGRVAEHVVLSTGMGSMRDVETGLAALAYGFTAPPEGVPHGLEDLEHAYASAVGQQRLRDRVTLLHCTTEYPAPFEAVNLRAMTTLRSAFGLRVGYSDHTQGTHVSLAAAALGAGVIEKHLTIDRTLPGPDHAASLEPAEFAGLVRHLRDLEVALGDGVKRAMPAEWKNRAVARKSLVAAEPIAAGAPFTSSNITCKRPGSGVPPEALWAYIGKPASRDFDADELIE